MTKKNHSNNLQLVTFTSQKVVIPNLQKKVNDKRQENQQK